MTWPGWLGLLLLASPTLHLPGLNTSFGPFRESSWPSPLELLSWQHGVATLDSLGGQARKVPLVLWIQTLHSGSSEHFGVKDREVPHALLLLWPHYLSSHQLFP